MLAISLLLEQNIDFSDALIAAEMIEEGVTEILSYDRDFDRISQIERVTP
ncbi:MAG: PIN domain-containing protein [Caldilineaceae bacterium]|nr:PIN domain-containing protein [Caldilineaceae bacterium]